MKYSDDDLKGSVNYGVKFPRERDRNPSRRKPKRKRLNIKERWRRFVKRSRRKK